MHFIDLSITFTVIFKFSLEIAKNEAPLNSCPLTSFRKIVEVLAIVMVFLFFFFYFWIGNRPVVKKQQIRLSLQHIPCSQMASRILLKC